MRNPAIVILGAALAIGSGLAAQQPAPPEAVVNLQPNVIGITRAREIALANVPQNFGILNEKMKMKKAGMLVYEFDIRTAGKGHQEVRIDAVTGAVVDNHHERDLIHFPFRLGGERSKPDSAMIHDSVFRRRALEIMRPNISEFRAREIAEQALPGAPVISVELLKKNALFYWRVKMKVEKVGDEEVQVDATTGTVLDVRPVNDEVTRKAEKLLQ